MNIKPGDRVKPSKIATRKVKNRLRHGGRVRQLLISPFSRPQNGLNIASMVVLVFSITENAFDDVWEGWVGLDQVELDV